MKKDKNKSSYQKGLEFAMQKKAVPSKVQKAYEDRKEWAHYWMIGYNYGYRGWRELLDHEKWKE